MCYFLSTSSVVNICRCDKVLTRYGSAQKRQVDLYVKCPLLLNCNQIWTAGENVLTELPSVKFRENPFSVSILLTYGGTEMAKRMNEFLKRFVANAQRENSNTFEMVKFNNAFVVCIMTLSVL